MMNSESPPASQKRKLGLLQQNQEHGAAANQNTRMRTTIHSLSEGVIGISLELLGGNGHFRYGPLACKIFLRASEFNPGFKKITTMESVTSSISCATKYFQDKGTDTKHLKYFWFNAARYGHVDVMEWARNQGYSDVRTQTHDWRGSISSFTCAISAKSGQLQALQRLKENRCDWNELTCAAAAQGGHLSIIQWARENDCPWDKATCAAGAAGYGHLSILQWLRENGCPWDKEICRVAAENGHLSCLQWARENGCPWDADTCAAAAQGGHLSCLQWLRENGCDWEYDTCEAAAYNGHLSCLQWARENGCDWDKEICRVAAENGHLSCLQWARENGCD